MRGLVWGLTFNDGLLQMQKIEQSYLFLGYSIVRKISGNQSYHVVFDNGDIWKVVRSVESARGHRANISYVDIRISQEFIETIIRHCTYLPPYNAIRYFYPEDWTREENEIE